MRKTGKIWLIIASILVGVGLVAFVIVMSVLAWDFSKLSTVKMQTREYTLEQAVESISIDTATADVTFVKTDDGTRKIVCYEEVNRAHAVSTQDGALSVNVTDTRKWYEYIGISWHNPSVTVYLPETEYGVLQMKSSTGDIEIPQAFRFDSVDISASTADVEMGATVINGVKIKTTTGSVRIENSSVGSLSITVSTGKVNVNNVTVGGELKIDVSTGNATVVGVTCQLLISSGSTGDIVLENVIATQSFHIERDTGNVRFTLCDAGEITVETDTGNVKGSFLTDKVFIADSDTGRVTVPQTQTGGRCVITTDTGDIHIEIKQN